MNMYIANCAARQSFVLQYRLPEQAMNSQPRELTIRAMSIGMLRDLTQPEFDAIEAQLTRFGAVEANARVASVAWKVERIYSKDPIKPERVRQFLALNVGLMNEEGRERLNQTAAALSSRANEVLIGSEVDGNLTTLEITLQENSDDPKIGLGARVTPGTEAKAEVNYRRRNRPRKATRALPAESH